MPLAIFFWVLFIIWFLFGGVYLWRTPAPGGPSYYGLGGHGLLAVLIFLLGWSTFGSMVK